ncbi:MAG TPA: pilus assembly protein PilM [Candidatus Bathyarchaeia archaeon]|nr:pilus assembly protein PilM [Candidatus Bathyarchaeia archaeon]
MIKNVFIPECIGSYYLFGKNIIGIDIGKTQIQAAKVRYRGRERTVLACDQESLEAQSTTPYQERTVAAINTLLDRMGKYDALYTSMSGSMAVFKELKLPFVEYEKIKLVIAYEVEPLLPFALGDAVIDFIITNVYKEEKSADILVAALQKSSIREHLSLFPENRQPTVITLDVFDLYSYYKSIPSYAAPTHGVAILDLGVQSTRVLYIHNGQLRVIRTLPKGLSTVAKSISEKISIPMTESLESLIRFGLERSDLPAYKGAVVDAFKSFWADIAFTFTSLQTQFKQYSVEEMILVGNNAAVNGLCSLAEGIIPIPCSIFDPHAIEQGGIVKIKDKNVSIINTISMATALHLPPADGCNFRKQEFKITSQRQLIQQVASMITCTVLLFSIFVGYSVMRRRAYAHEAEKSTAEVLRALKEQFAKEFEREKNVKNLDDALYVAEREIGREKETWFVFSGKTRMSFLHYLLELTNRIDKKSLGFSIEELNIGDGIITLKAQVKNHEALKILERELRRSPLFSYIEPQDNPKFTMKIVLATEM